MPANKQPRLLSVAKEFNIGKDTLISFLEEKKFKVKNLTSTSKLSHEMYLVLEKKFSEDKIARQKSAKASTETEELAEIISAKKAAGTITQKPHKEKETKVLAKKDDVIKGEVPVLKKIKVFDTVDLEKKSTPKPNSAPTVTPDKKEDKNSSSQKKKDSPKTEEGQDDIKRAPDFSLHAPQVLDKIDIDKINALNQKKPFTPKLKKENEDSAKSVGSKRKRIIRKPGSSQPIDVAEIESAAQNKSKRYIPKTDKQDIKDRIRATKSRMEGKKKLVSSKKMKIKMRKQKSALASQEKVEKQLVENTTIQVIEFVSVSELASLINVPFSEIISTCMNLGIMVSVNQRLDAEIIELVAGEYGFKVNFMTDDENVIEEEVFAPEEPASLVERPPIVTIMGHVDHGKTSLLDFIRKSNVVAGESGGITQHIGAYEVALPNGKQITFLDTPGHEAFTSMRARGAKVTDVVIVVIAADDTVMPQTREAISHAQAASVPIIFAINKMDKEGAQPEKIKEQLSSMDLLVEDWGGKYQCQQISSKTGLNVDKLLEKVLLEADLLELKANPNKPAKGTIIEATLDKGKGYIAKVLVQEGTLNAGDMMIAGPYFGRVKAMINEREARVKNASLSTPVLVLGLNGSPQSGEKFAIYTNEAQAKEIANKRSQMLREQSMRTKKHITLDEIGRRLSLGNFKELNLIIKADYDGSVEALADAFQKLANEEVNVRVVHKAVGQVSESDVLLAAASESIIIGFQVRPSAQALQLAEKEDIEIKTYSIIYHAIEEVKSAMEGMLKPTIREKITGNIEIRELFKINNNVVAGCMVLNGKVHRSSKIKVIRDGIVVYSGTDENPAELNSLKRYKDDVKEVSTGMECGLTIKNYHDIKVNDVIETYEAEQIQKQL